jgi:hypothetical protein
MRRRWMHANCPWQKDPYGANLIANNCLPAMIPGIHDFLGFFQVLRK